MDIMGNAAITHTVLETMITKKEKYDRKTADFLIYKLFSFD